MKCIVITLIVSIATLILGLYFGWKYIGAGEVAATLTVMKKKAVGEGYMSEEKFTELLEKSGKELQKEYPSVAKAIQSTKSSAKIAPENAAVIDALTKEMETE